MKRFTWPVLSLITLLSMIGCASGPTIVSIEWVDFIKFNDITYIRVHQGVSVNEKDLSPYGEIKFKTAGNVESLKYEIKNGDAAFLEAGTLVYSLTGYAPTFRLVARQNQELFIYEVDTNPQAKKGSDFS